MCILTTRLNSNDLRFCRITIKISLTKFVVYNTYALAAEFEDIYQWTVDFFGIQAGDSFAVIYDEKYVDGQSVGIGRIWGAVVNHSGKQYYAIPYAQEEGKLRSWEANGESLRKQMLKLLRCPRGAKQIKQKEPNRALF